MVPEKRMFMLFLYNQLFQSAKRYVSKSLATKIEEACSPMLTWLKEADTESDEDEDEDDGENEKENDEGDENEAPVVVTNSVNAPPKSAEQKTTEVAAEEESDDDLDIDAIQFAEII